MAHLTRRAAVAGLSGLTIAPWLPGCGSKPDGMPAQQGKPRIALVMKSLANEFFSTMAAGAKRHQADHADEYDLIVNGIQDERDLTRQSALVAEMAAQGVAAIVIAPADSRALVTPLQRAAKQGLTIVNIDNRLDTEVLKQIGLQAPFVGPDNRAGARKVGDALAKALKPGSQVAMLEGIVTSFNSQQRRLGFEDAMKTAGMPLVAIQSAQWETAPANQATASLLNAHPELKAVICCNDSMALGALAAVKSAGKAGQVLIVGFDSISAVQAAIRAGEILATADQHGDQLAILGIGMALELLHGKATPADRETPVNLITRESLQ